MAIFGGSLRDALNSATGSGSSETRARESFFFTVKTGNFEHLKKILRQYPEALKWRDAENLTGLMVAAREGNSATVGVFLGAGSDINAVNENGSTALMFAAFAGKAVVAEQLVKAGANVNHVNQKGHTPLMSAAAHGFTNTLRVLLEHGAESRTADFDGTTALDYAKDNGHKEIVETLVRRKQIQDERGPAAKDFAASASRPASVPEPANLNTVPPEKQAVYDQNTSALRDLERRMGKAGLF